MIIKTLNKDKVEEMTGYRPFTTFYEDFSIADNFGKAAIKDTYKRAFKGWKDNHKYLTELVMILNWKIWEHYDNGNEEYAYIYDEFWREAGQYALDNLEGDELNYYLDVTD